MATRKTVVPVKTSDGIKLVDKKTRELAGSVSTLGKNAPTISALPPIVETPIFSTDYIDYFTEEYCDQLAIALHKKTGWQLFVCAEDWLNEEAHDERCYGEGVIHVLVRLPDGTFLDINGIQTEDQVLQKWPDTFLRVTEGCCFRTWVHSPGYVDNLKVKQATKVLLKLAKEHGHFVNPQILESLGRVESLGWKPCE